MEIIRFVDTIFETNSYVIIYGDKSIIIDPGFSYKELTEYIQNNSPQLERY